MKNITKIAIGGAMIWYFVLRGASAVITKVKSYSIRYIDIANKQLDINLSFYIKNPLFVGIELKRLSGDIYIQGNKCGAIDTQLDYFLSGLHTHIIPVVANIDMEDLSQSVIANIQSGDIRTLTIAFNGAIHVGKYGIPIPVEITLDWNDLKK